MGVPDRPSHRQNCWPIAAASYLSLLYWNNSVVDEGKKVCQVAKETGMVLQIGTQQRSEFDDRSLKAVVLARSGRLGKNLQAFSSVGQAAAGGPFKNSEPPSELDWDFWLDQTPQVAYCKQRCNYDFRWWLEYSGGQVTDWGVHHTDIACWALDTARSWPLTGAVLTAAVTRMALWRLFRLERTGPWQGSRAVALLPTRSTRSKLYSIPPEQGTAGHPAQICSPESDTPPQQSKA